MPIYLISSFTIHVRFINKDLHLDTIGNSETEWSYLNATPKGLAWGGGWGSEKGGINYYASAANIAPEIGKPYTLSIRV